MFGLELGLSTGLMIFFIICVFAVLAFEFVNGFHDTANAVATVIYTKSLKPIHAVIWSGLMNFLGVISSGIIGYKVAMKIVALLPSEAIMGQSIAQGAAMMLAILITSILWNLLTWYFGIPCSSSHTMIGSLLGVGMVYSWLPQNTERVGVNWDEAATIGYSLLLSPAFGFTMAIALMFLLRGMVKHKQLIFKEPPTEDNPPPVWIRVILITTCTLVSFFHGQNDGQKGLGLLLVVLMTFAPLQFSLSPDYNNADAIATLAKIQESLPKSTSPEAKVFVKEINQTIETIELLKQDIAASGKEDVRARLAIRKRIGLLTKNLDELLKYPNIITNKDSKKAIKNAMKKMNDYTQHIPWWAILMISIALGLGTMIGWKRIVVTIGEKIGKRHMTYAEGATAELIAATTIGLSSQFGLPVSTTHVLSSGVAGSMVASKGVKNLQTGTITNIALAWVLTLPVTIILAGLLYWIFLAFV